jgi:hypothetical protein
MTLTFTGPLVEAAMQMGVPGAREQVETGVSNALLDMLVEDVLGKVSKGRGVGKGKMDAESIQYQLNWMLHCVYDLMADVPKKNNQGKFR